MKPRNLLKKQQKEDIFKNLYGLSDGMEMALDAFKSKIFPMNKIKDIGFSNFDHSNLIILTPKQMRQRLPIALAEVNAGNTSENLLNKIRQIIYFIYPVKEITKKVYDNIMDLIKV